MDLTGIRLGAPIMYESSYKFDKVNVIKRCEDLAAATPGFSRAAMNIEIGDAGTTAVGQFANENFDPLDQANQPHTWPELQGFVEWLGPVANRIFQSWEFDFDNISIANSWVNRHRKGGWTNFHVHRNAHLSVAAYIQADEDSGHLLMADPLENHWGGYPVIRKSEINGGYRLPVKDNTVYLFAPFVRHGTEASKSNKDRWVLSLNLHAYKGN